jgi:hypothetical protein
MRKPLGGAHLNQVALFEFGESCPSFPPRHLSPLSRLSPFRLRTSPPTNPGCRRRRRRRVSATAQPNPVAAPALPGGLGDRSSLVAQAFPLTAAVQAFPGGRASLPGDRARSWATVVQVGGAPPEVPLTRAKEQRSDGSATNRTNHQDLGTNRHV